MDDDELIAAVAGGDAGLRELFSRHAPWLAARLRGVLPAAEVEDRSMADEHPRRLTEHRSH